MNKNIAIKVQNLTKTYKLYKAPIDRLKESLNPFKKKYHKDFYALKNVSLDIKKGETVGIVGKNGSGKSTLLKIITGVLTPTSGRVIVHGKISAILELGAGFNPEMSGLENIYLNTSINGMSKNDTDKKIDEIINFSELGEFIYQPLKTYSSGMKARLAFAVAINIEPDILIVDEALAVGDAAFQRKCFAKMEEIRQSGATILFVSHSEASIVSLCSRAIWLSNGEKIIDGEPKLVTGLYMKNSTKKNIDKVKIEQEYNSLINLQQSEKNKKVIILENFKDNSNLNTYCPKLNSSVEEFYDSSLTPKSTIYYEEKGAKISDIKITSLDGKKVNVLVHGRDYIYSYKVNVLCTLENVQVGFSIKKRDGVAIGGGVYPSKSKYINILDNDILVEVTFTCQLNNGEYFVNAGVQALVESKIDFAHRIIDGYMFKVINANNNITGSVNLIKDIAVNGENL